MRHFAVQSCVLTSLAIVLAFVSGCSSTPKQSASQAQDPATQPTKESGKESAKAAPKPAQWLQLVKLSGEWVDADAKGTDVGKVVSTFSMTAGNSALREVMFPGLPHEMTNMYHPDGEGVLMTHYCAAGNQPRMRANVLAHHPDTIDFQFESVTNKIKSTDTYMGRCMMTMRDDDTLDVAWTSYQEGKDVEHVTFHWKRKK